jgi:hypothetical protein
MFSHPMNHDEFVEALKEKSGVAGGQELQTEAAFRAADGD